MEISVTKGFKMLKILTIVMLAIFASCGGGGGSSSSLTDEEIAQIQQELYNIDTTMEGAQGFLNSCSVFYQYLRVIGDGTGNFQLVGYYLQSTHENLVSEDAVVLANFDETTTSLEFQIDYGTLTTCVITNIFLDEGTPGIETEIRAECSFAEPYWECTRAGAVECEDGNSGCFVWYNSDV